MRGNCFGQCIFCASFSFSAKQVHVCPDWRAGRELHHRHLQRHQRVKIEKKMWRKDYMQNSAKKFVHREMNSNWSISNSRPNQMQKKNCVLNRRKQFFESILLRHSACKCQPGKREHGEGPEAQGASRGKDKNSNYANWIKRSAALLPLDFCE